MQASASAQLVDKKSDYWSISVAYPKFSARTTSAAFANKWARVTEGKVFDEFLAQAKRDLPELKRMRSSAQYDLLVQPTITLQSALVCSGYATSYAYTGGAHGMTSFTPINVSSSGKTIKLADLFVRGADSVGECSYAILGELLRQERGSYVLSGEWKRLEPAQVNQFVLTPDGILFLFGPYELGPYSDGAFLVKIPYSRLQGLDINGPYGGLFNPKKK
ncbi:MAG: DUF3298 domain-containing protein [Fimbriimonas sp.]